MPLTILSDDDVCQLLHSLTREDVLQMQTSLGDALHYYSTTTEDDNNGCCASFQPMRTALQLKTGSTTLFMPASSNEGIGVKIVTLSEGEPSAQSSVGSRTASISSKEETSSTHTKSSSISSASGQTSLSSLTNLSISDTSATSHRSSLSALTPSATTSTTSPSSSRPSTPKPSSNIASKGAGTSPAGSLTLLDVNGTPRALINASEITAFRTALASMALFKKRANVHDVVIFGAGKQAYWHARLALLLRGEEIHHLTFFNRSFERAHNVVLRLFKTPWPVKLSHPQIAMITPAHAEYDRHLKAKLREASVIITCTPSTTPLFPAEILTSTQGRQKGRYIVAIGSYKPHMCELHPDVIRQAVAPHHLHHHVHKHAKTGGAIVVDSVEGCLQEAGELIQAGVSGREVVELGELIMLRREAEKIRSSATSSTTLDSEGIDSEGVEIGAQRKTKKKGFLPKLHHEKESSLQEDRASSGLKEWLVKGNVIYKSVGLGLMDVVVGNDLVKIADARGVGTRIENF